MNGKLVLRPKRSISSSRSKSVNSVSKVRTKSVRNKLRPTRSVYDAKHAKHAMLLLQRLDKTVRNVKLKWRRSVRDGKFKPRPSKCVRNVKLKSRPSKSISAWWLWITNIIVSWLKSKNVARPMLRLMHGLIGSMKHWNMYVVQSKSRRASDWKESNVNVRGPMLRTDKGKNTPRLPHGWQVKHSRICFKALPMLLALAMLKVVLTSSYSQPSSSNITEYTAEQAPSTTDECTTPAQLPR